MAVILGCGGYHFWLSGVH